MTEQQLDHRDIEQEAIRLYLRRMLGRMPRSIDQEQLYIDQCRRAALARHYGKDER